MKKNVAIIGKAPSSRMLAPYDDDSWEIWSLSDNFNVIPRWDRWFEIHDLDRYSEHYPDYYDWMASRPAGDKPLYINGLRDEIPAGVQFPWESLRDRFGRYFTNSISWMTAFAINELEQYLSEEEKPCIGLWGVDMAVNEEYAHQRPSCEYFLGIAKGMGFEIFVPDEADMLKCGRMYAVEGNIGVMDRKIRARQAELAQRQAKLEAQRDEAAQASYAASGALHELNSVAQRLNGQGGDWIEDRLKQIQADIEASRAASKQYEAQAYQLAGARENLNWCKQWA